MLFRSILERLELSICPVAIRLAVEAPLDSPPIQILLLPVQDLAADLLDDRVAVFAEDGEDEVGEGRAGMQEGGVEVTRRENNLNEILRS